MALIFFLSVGTVNAADNETDDVISVTNQELQSNNDYKSFRNLQDVPLNLIDTYENKSNGDSKEVLINKNITINNKDFIVRCT